MEIVPFVIVTWLIHAGIAAVLSAPIVFFSRKRIHWRRYELLAFVIPFGVWFALCGFSGIRSKTLSNAAIEPAMFSLAVPIAALVRVAVGTRISERACVAGLIGAVSVVAVVRLHPGHVWRVLGRMGWSIQRPAGKAAQRDELAIARWKKHTWPRLKKVPEGRPNDCLC